MSGAGTAEGSLPSKMSIILWIIAGSGASEAEYATSMQACVISCASISFRTAMRRSQRPGSICGQCLVRTRRTLLQWCCRCGYGFENPTLRRVQGHVYAYVVHGDGAQGRSLRPQGVLRVGVERFLYPEHWGSTRILPFMLGTRQTTNLKTKTVHF